MPPAILRDVAGGPTEFLVGSPGGQVTRASAATAFSPPQVGGATVFFSVLHGRTTWIYRGVLGGCAEHVAEGTLGAVERQGRAFTALDGAHWVMFNRDGRKVTRLTGAAGAWTSDGRLVEPTAAGIDLFSISGQKRTLSVAGNSPLSPLGAHQELVSTAAGVQVLDLDTSNVEPLKAAGQAVLRAVAGSPDGTRVAFLDSAGAARVLTVASGKSEALALSSLPTGFTWSGDSHWLAVQGVYGGVELSVEDGRVIDSSPLTVLSW